MPQASTDYLVDADGLAVPDIWQPRPDKWLRLPLAFRKRQSDQYLARLSASPKPEKTHGPGATRFTTDYAIRWGRKQGWKLIERESYDYRTRRHHDCQLGTDAIFEGPNGLIGIQGAGRHERAIHYQRFLDRGGPEKAALRHIQIIYLEFERGNFTPLKEEIWVPPT